MIVRTRLIGTLAASTEEVHGAGVISLAGFVDFSLMPAMPTAGDYWADSESAQIQQWDGAAWVLVPGADGRIVAYGGHHYIWDGDSWSPLVDNSPIIKRGHAVILSATAGTVFFEDAFIRLRLNSAIEIQCVDAPRTIHVYTLASRRSGTVLPPATAEGWVGGQGAVTVAAWTAIESEVMTNAERSMTLAYIQLADQLISYDLRFHGSSLGYQVTVLRYDYRNLAANTKISF